MFNFIFFFPSLSSRVPLTSAQQPQNTRSFYLHTSDADPHRTDDFQMLLNEVFQLGNTTILQGEGGGGTGKIIFNLTSCVSL